MRGHTRRAAAGLAFLFVLGCTPQAAEPSAPPSGSPAPPPTSAPTVAPTDAPGPSPTTDTADWDVIAVAPMLRARDGFRVLPLGDETVLVVGDDGACRPGPAEPGSETSERYDPIADEWTIAASLNKPRKDFAMAPAQEGGVMVLGGINDLDQPFSSTKRFDLDSATWVDGPLLNVAYGDPSAVTLADGSVYVVGPDGRYHERPWTSTTDILPAGGEAWVAGLSLADVAVQELLDLGTGVLAVGSTFESPPQLWVTRPESAGTWEQLSAPELSQIERVVEHAGGLLAFGLRYDEASGASWPTSPLLWDPISGAWTETGPMATPRSGAAIATLADGRVLVAGGIAGPQDFLDTEMVATTEVYDPGTGTWFAGPNLLGPREGGQTVVLDDGSILIMGGVDVRNEFGDTPFCPGTLTTVERIVPTPWASPEV